MQCLFTVEYLTEVHRPNWHTQTIIWTMNRSSVLFAVKSGALLEGFIIVTTVILNKGPTQDGTKSPKLRWSFPGEFEQFSVCKENVWNSEKKLLRLNFKKKTLLDVVVSLWVHTSSDQVVTGWSTEHFIVQLSKLNA